MEKSLTRMGHKVGLDVSRKRGPVQAAVVWARVATIKNVKNGLIIFTNNSRKTSTNPLFKSIDWTNAD